MSNMTYMEKGPWLSDNAWCFVQDASLRALKWLIEERVCLHLQRLILHARRVQRLFFPLADSHQAVLSAIIISMSTSLPSLTRDSWEPGPRCCQAKYLFLCLWTRVWGRRQGGRRIPNVAFGCWLGRWTWDKTPNQIRGHLGQPLFCSDGKANTQEDVLGSTPFGSMAARADFQLTLLSPL